MKLKPLSWEHYGDGDGGRLKGLRHVSLDQPPDAREDVRRELGANGQARAEPRRTLRVLDDAFAALPPPERQAIEYTALLSEVLVPAPWLEQPLDHDGARRDGGTYWRCLPPYPRYLRPGLLLESTRILGNCARGGRSSTGGEYAPPRSLRVVRQRS
ncbi:MAG: hypothetical protein AB7N65_28305 [Vicinamibacterales bacterium]